MEGSLIRGQPRNASTNAGKHLRRASEWERSCDGVWRNSRIDDAARNVSKGSSGGSWLD